jgi:septum formation protein
MRFPVISDQNPLILASASPRRKRLLSQIGLPFRSIPGKVNEQEVQGVPIQTSRLLAEKKACQAFGKVQPAWVLGADTIVVINEEILGKPKDEAEARHMLRHLSEKEHRVITGLCILDPSGRPVHSDAIATLVRFKRLNEREIEGYLHTGEPYGKAGGYGIQGIGAFMVETISGSYTNVVGLPLCALVKALVEVGALKGFPLRKDRNP